MSQEVNVDDPIHREFRASVESLVAEWRHRVIDLREPVDPAIELAYLPEPVQAAAAATVIDLRSGLPVSDDAGERATA